MISIDIVKIDEIVKANRLEAVTDPIYIDFSKRPTDKGLFSYEIFGKSPVERRTIFGYIDLKHTFLHPVIYKMMHTLKRDVVKCINTTEKYILDGKGDLVKDPENGETGIDFIYENWDSINFDPKLKSSGEEASEVRKSYSTLLKKMKKDEIFITKWLVLPPFYRDLDMNDLHSGKIKVDEINDLYRKILSLTSNLNNDVLGFSFMVPKTYSMIQNTLLEIYMYFHLKLGKKRGIIKSKLLKKVVDYSTRSVIHINKTDSETWKDNPINYSTSGIPLSHAISLFMPLVEAELISTMDSLVEGSPELAQKDRDTITKKFTSNNVKKILDKLVRDPHSRLERIELYKNSRTPVYLKQSFTINGEIKPAVEVTWLEFMFSILAPIVRGKNVAITRYPIENYQSIFITQVRILTTLETITVSKSGIEYVDFPKLERDENGKLVKLHEVNLIDSVKFSSSYLSGIGGDFDGDTVSLRAMLSVEGNDEAEMLRKKKISLLNMNGRSVRNLKNEGVLSLYSLTKKKKSK